MGLARPTWGREVGGEIAWDGGPTFYYGVSITTANKNADDYLWITD